MSEVEFELRKLGDLIEIYNNKRVPLSAKQREGLEKIYPYYGAQGIVDYVDDYIFDGKYILIAEDGENLKSNNKSICTLATGKYWVNNHAHIIEGNDETNTDFLYYKLNSISFAPYITGSAQPKLNKENLLNIELYIPSREHQDKIAKVLTLLDQKIQTNNQINQELEAMAKTLYDYWFVQFDFPDQNGKPYKSSGGKMVYNPELKREIPERWGVEKLGDITICHDSKRVPLSSNDRELVKGEIPYYGATGIMDYVNDYIFDGDYVLMAEDGSVMTEKGTPILQRISGKNWVNNHAHVLEPVKNHSCKLLMMLLKDVSVMQIKTGSIQMKINQENMNKIVVPAIPLELLFEINQKLEVIDKQQLNLIEENKQLTQLRDWLLPMLMNGQVKVE